jgi:2-polyprenyl-3-methyl-5-hydroxy-6-metoxy-1,4-benzoquinol methylase
MWAVASGEWLADNKAIWDERVPVHAASELYDLPGVLAGRDRLRPWEDSEMGTVAGLDVIHLQCHIGTDTVALARRGARVTGLDFSEPALKAAADLAATCGVMIDWACANVYDAYQATGGRHFDVVYTGMGALGWLPDLRRWAEIVDGLLRSGGMLYMTEFHPMWVALVRDGRTTCQHAIHADFMRWHEKRGSYAAPDAVFGHSSTWERLHTISDLLSAVIDAGLRIELFHEFDMTPCPCPWLVPGADGLYRFPDGMYRFPLCYSLRARKP